MINGFKVQGSKFKVEGMLFFFLISTMLFSCSPKKDRIYKKSMLLMDTLVTVTLVTDSPEKADDAMEKVFGEVRRLDGLFNFFSEKSELSLVNRNAGIGEIPVSPETIEVIEKALYTSEKTGGAFDITIGPEISLWDFPAGRKADEESVRERLGLVNYRWITVNREKSSVGLGKKGMLMDLGAIAKGYAADRAVETLRAAGIRSGLVAVAGDIKAFGSKPDGKPWRVGIRNPRQKGKDDEIVATVELKDMAISTSGDYERYFFIGDKRYHHILDPRTGYPAEGCRSVTVMAPDGVFADSFSTAVFVLGPDKGMGVLKQMGFEGLIIDRNGGIHATPAMKGGIEPQRND